MGQTGPQSSPVRSPRRPPSRPRLADSRPRRATDVSPFRGFEQPCVGTPSEGLEAPLPPRRAPPLRSPSESRFPTKLPISAVSCPPPSIEFRLNRPERSLSPKCSLFFSCRAGFAPVPATKSPLPLLPRQTQSRVQPLHMVRTLPFRRSLEETLCRTPLAGHLCGWLRLATGDAGRPSACNAVTSSLQYSQMLNLTCPQRLYQLKPHT